MAIPEVQLETWSHQGSIQQSSSTYQTLRNALLSPKALYAGKRFDVFLQGSYGNDTNIRVESDVDIIIRLDSIMRSDLSELPIEQQAAYHNVYKKASYTFNEFRDGVITRLNTAFGVEYVEVGNKAIKVKENGSRRNADVVVCFQFRQYLHFINSDDYEYVPGIIFPTRTGGEVINYPKLHSDNCTGKHHDTTCWFKPMVRILKNARSKLVEDGVITSDIAPSYFIEGLLYNVSKENFGTNYEETFYNCINWLMKADRSAWWCANEQYLLLGDSNVQWASAKCDQFLKALAALWNDWS